jgi:hypothetical protein
MIRTFISLSVAFLVAVLVYLALPNEMYVEKAENIIVLAFIGAAVITWLVIMRKRR